MIGLTEILLSGFALLILVPVTVVFIEVLLAAPVISDATPQDGDRRRLAVLIPAHDEAATIVATIQSIIPQLHQSDRLIVVVDNCSDDTATIASEEGSEVIIRNDPMFRGKGYALDFGVRSLTDDAPEIVIVIDADCQVGAGAIHRLACLCAQTARPTQALYLMNASKDANAKLRIAQFAWLIKNQIRPMGLKRLGLPCQLMGTGMAFPWQCIKSATLATGHIVEDLKLGLDLARAGTPPLFCPDALVTSTFPTSSEGIRNQRTRWEHGHLSVIVAEAPRLLMRSILRLDVGLFALALDLSVPPLALLALQVLLIWLVSLFLYLFTRDGWPLGLSTVAMILLSVSALTSWRRYGRSILSPSDLSQALIYALWKIPLYVKFLTARQIKWIRSKRDNAQSD